MKRHLLTLELVVFIALIFLGVLSIWFLFGTPYATEYYAFHLDFDINFYSALLVLGLWFAQIGIAVGIAVIIGSVWKKRRKKLERQATVRAYTKTSHEAIIRAIKAIVVVVPALLIVYGFFACAGAYTLEIISKNVGMQTFGFFLILTGIMIYLAELGAAVAGPSEPRAVGMTCPSCGVKMIQTVNGFPDGGIYNSPFGTSTRVAA